MNSEERRERTTRTFVVTAISFMLVGVGVLTYRLVFSETIAGRTGWTIAGLASLAYGGFILVYLYLVGRFNFGWLARMMAPISVTVSTETSSYSPFVENEITRELQKLRSSLISLKEAQLSESGTGELPDDLRESLVQDAAKVLNDELSRALTTEAHLTATRSAFSEHMRRLNLDLDALNRRSAINLAIGGVSTVFAAGLLVYMVLWRDQKFSTVADVLSFYVPRLTVVVFIEAFAFFFLRLYKATLQEFRVCQRELTDLGLKQVALEAAWTAEQGLARAEVAKSLSTANSVADASIASENVDPKLLLELLATFGKVVAKKE